MKQFTYAITDPIGIHARPAGMLAQLAKSFAVEGGDEDAALAALEAFMKENL